MFVFTPVPVVVSCHHIARGTAGDFGDEHQERGVHVHEEEEEEGEPVARPSPPVPGLGSTTPRRVSFASAEQVCVCIELVLRLIG